jgi:hypothetical protein
MKAFLVVVDCNSSIYWTLARIADLAVKQENFLMYLSDNKSATAIFFSFHPRHVIPMSYQTRR